MRAVICGAGVAGLTLASQLSQSGWDVLILEREGAPAAGAFLVDLADDGLAAAERIGVLSKLREVGECITRVRWVDGRGSSIADVNVPMEVRSQRGTLKVLRTDLERVLLEALPSNVEVRFGFDVSDIRTPLGSVEMALRPSGHTKADLLIGADGVHSRIRDLVFGDGTLWNRELGYDSASFVFEDRAVLRCLEGKFTVLSVPGRHIVLCPMRSGKIAVTLIHPSTPGAMPVAVAEHLRELYGHLQWCVPGILDAASSADELRYERAVQIKMPAWHRGRVGLLGDACHAYSLLPGQGSSVAMAAAYWLAREIRRAPSIDGALARYQSRLMNEIANRRSSTRRTAHWLVPAGRGELALRNTLLRLVSVSGVRRFLGSVVRGVA
jgi:2-polyprenyl-6-methoxyphenol hydroxylase-like FAD-dependent oxidoreductase